MSHPLLLALWMGCTSQPVEAEPTTPRLRIGGSETLTRALVPTLAQTHERSKHTLAFAVSGGGSGAGIRQLLAGELDIAAASRPHRHADEEQARANGYSLEAEGARHVIGMDVVALQVHPSSPVETLTYDQVIGIFCDGTLDNLQFLGEGMPDRPIRALTRDPRSGTRTLFEDFFCGPTGIHERIEVASAEAIAEAVRDDPDVLAFASMADLAGRAVALKPDVANPAVMPSQRTVANGSYPLYRDLYLYTPGPATGDASAFVDWVLSPAGQEVVDQARFVPIYHRTAKLEGPRPLRETVHFDVGQTYPNQRSIARIQLLVQELQGRREKGQHIVLEGFADDREPDPVALSEQRANAVRDLLGQQLDDPFFEVIPRGTADPLAPNTTPYGRQRNRRVQVYLADEDTKFEAAVVSPEKTPPENGAP